MTANWFLKAALVTAIVLLPDYYVIHPSVRVIFFLVCLITAWDLLNRIYFSGRRVSHCVPHINRDTRTILILAIVFLFYIFVVDVYRDSELSSSIISFFGGLLSVALLPIFERGRDKFDLYKVFGVCLWISVVFGALQFSGFYYTLGELFPNLVIIRADNVWKANSEVEYFRMTGAGGNLIAFATYLTVMSLIMYCSLLNRFSAQKLFKLLLLLALLLSTQLRTLVFTLPIALILIAWFNSRKRARLVVTYVPLIALMTLPVVIFGNELAEIFSYLTREITVGDTYRFSVNYYMTIGVFQESPWFGISGNDAWDIYLRYGNPYIYSNQLDAAVPTHHNQLAYYFRYYGLIGVILFCALCVGIVKKIAAAPSKIIRLILASIFVLDFLSSMAHNNKIIGSYILWIFLSWAAYDPENERRLFP